MAQVFIEDIHQRAIDVSGLGDFPSFKPGEASADARLILADGTDLGMTLRLTGDEYALLARLTEMIGKRALATIRAGVAT